MADCQINFITKSSSQAYHEHITHVGNTSSVPPWKWTREDVIKSIENRTNTFYVLDAVTGKRAYVGVVRQAGRAPYLRTHADGIWTDNLLSLPIQ